MGRIFNFCLFFKILFRLFVVFVFYFSFTVTSIARHIYIDVQRVNVEFKFKTKKKKIKSTRDVCGGHLLNVNHPPCAVSVMCVYCVYETFGIA